jgi:holo-[acyl-carrier protein] synthase
MVGVDIVSISRVQNSIDKFGDKFLDRFLSKKEKKLIKTTSNVAGFWAAKEAASKAIGTGIGINCSFLDIKLSKTDKNAPILKYKKKLRKRYNIKQSSVSITHDGDFAIAVVVNVII